MCRSELEAPLKFPRAKELGWNKMAQLSPFSLKLAEKSGGFDEKMLSLAFDAPVQTE